MSKGNDSQIEVAASTTYVAAFIDTPLRDPRLSWKAKGLAAYLLSKPPGWKIWTSDLIRRSTDGRDAVLSGLAELEQCGYLKRERSNDPETGLLRWRKTICATPASAWQEPSPENPVMDEQPSTGFPYTDEPTTDKPTHSSSQGSKSLKVVKASKSEEKGAAGAPVPVTSKGEGVAGQDLAIVQRIAEDCRVSAPVDMLAAYGMEHVRAEAVRWWNETPAHNRKQNAGLLVYRIKNRKYKPLTTDERMMCERYGYWVPIHEDDIDEDTAAPVVSASSAPAEQAESAPKDTTPHYTSYDPSNPLSAWDAILHELDMERNDANIPGSVGSEMWRWLAACTATIDGETLVVKPPSNLYIDWARARLTPRLSRKLRVMTMRTPEGAPQAIQFTA